jgi:hypothetical protein
MGMVVVWLSGKECPSPSLLEVEPIKQLTHERNRIKETVTFLQTSKHPNLIYKQNGQKNLKKKEKFENITEH